MIRGDVLDLGTLGQAAGKAASEGDIDKVLSLLDKADKLLNNPLIQGFLGLKTPQPMHENAETVPVVQVVSEVPKGAIVPTSEVHAKMYGMMQKMNAEQLMGLLSQYGGEDAKKAVEFES